VYEWELIERIREIGGSSNPFRTMWMTAMLSDDAGEKSLEMTLIDFRVLWADQARANRPPRMMAERAVKL